ncbi:MAG TPA: hypothetical protein VLA04_02850 [Verrucomicrobiae bacterium]|nr:hypothetical protein [Verrucomicrobiae bacterium]
MRTRIALFFLLALGIISSAELTSIVLTLSPYKATPAELWLFFISLYCTSTIVLGFLWQGIRFVRSHRASHPSLWTSLRQAGLLCLVIILSFFFNTLGIFQFWDVIPLIVAAILIEFFFQADKKPHATLSYDRES